MQKDRKLRQVLDDECASVVEIIEAQDGYMKPIPPAPIRPIEIDGEIKRLILKRLGISNGNLYLHTKYSDACLHKNDYINMETPLRTEAIQFSEEDGIVLAMRPKERLLFEWILIPCKGMVSIKEIFDEEEKFFSEELIEPEVEDPNRIKFCEIIERSKRVFYCVGCTQPYHLIGRGSYRVEDTLYKGVHIVVYPETDIIFQSEKSLSSREHASLYFKQLKEIVNAPKE
ncbi:MAG: hypothetical protein WCJ39_07115 [bacterium]